VPTLFQPLPILQVGRLPVCLCAEHAGGLHSPSSRPTPRRSKPIATTGLPFTVGLGAEGALKLRIAG
jgi:hypothetical protein